MVNRRRPYRESRGSSRPISPPRPAMPCHKPKRCARVRLFEDPRREGAAVSLCSIYRTVCDALSSEGDRSVESIADAQERRSQVKVTLLPPVEPPTPTDSYTHTPNVFITSADGYHSSDIRHSFLHRVAILSSIIFISIL